MYTYFNSFYFALKNVNSDMEEKRCLVYAIQKFWAHLHMCQVGSAEHKKCDN